MAKLAVQSRNKVKFAGTRKRRVYGFNYLNADYKIQALQPTVNAFQAVFNPESTQRFKPQGQSIYCVLLSTYPASLAHLCGLHTEGI